jgi:hypothetical protein
MNEALGAERFLSRRALPSSPTGKLCRESCAAGPMLGEPGKY